MIGKPFKKGNIPWNKGLKGIHLSPISEFKKGNKGVWLGKKRPDLIKTKSVRTMFKKGLTPWNKGKKAPWSTEHIIKLNKFLFDKRGGTSIEKKVYEALIEQNVFFEKQYLINNHFIVDAYIPSLNLIIEADGDYWHNLEKTKKQDKAKNAYLSKCGFNLLRLSEKEINNGKFKYKICQLLQ